MQAVKLDFQKTLMSFNIQAMCSLMYTVRESEQMGHSFFFFLQYTMCIFTTVFVFRSDVYNMFHI